MKKIIDNTIEIGLFSKKRVQYGVIKGLVL